MENRTLEQWWWSWLFSCTGGERRKKRSVAIVWGRGKKAICQQLKAGMSAINRAAAFNGCILFFILQHGIILWAFGKAVDLPCIFPHFFGRIRAQKRLQWWAGAFVKADNFCLFAIFCIRNHLMQSKQAKNGSVHKEMRLAHTPIFAHFGPKGHFLFGGLMGHSLSLSLPGKHNCEQVPRRTRTTADEHRMFTTTLQGSDSQKPKVLFRVPPKVPFFSFSLARTHAHPLSCMLHACMPWMRAHDRSLLRLVLRFLPPGFYYYSRYISTRGPFILCSAKDFRQKKSLWERGGKPLKGRECALTIVNTNFWNKILLFSFNPIKGRQRFF